MIVGEGEPARANSEALQAEESSTTGRCGLCHQPMGLELTIGRHIRALGDGRFDYLRSPAWEALALVREDLSHDYEVGGNSAVTGEIDPMLAERVLARTEGFRSSTYTSVFIRRGDAAFATSEHLAGS